MAPSTPSMTGQLVELSRYALSIATVRWLDNLKQGYGIHWVTRRQEK